MDVLNDLLYTENHEWVKIDHDFAIIGITAFAAKELGEIVHIELPEVGDQITADDQIGTLEAVKTVEDIYSPISGEVVKINNDLFDAPNLINKSPYEDGWLIKMRYDKREDEMEKLLSAEEYKKIIQ